jgi:hypothetical protein
MKTVPEMLREAAATYEERNKLYRDNYKNFGRVMAGLFPKGLDCADVDDFNRLGTLIQIVSKLTRYCVNFERGGHDDSLLDLAVYSQMQRELDLMVRSAEESHPLSDLKLVEPEPDDVKIRRAKAKMPSIFSERL